MADIEIERPRRFPIYLGSWAPALFLFGLGVTGANSYIEIGEDYWAFRMGHVYRSPKIPIIEIESVRGLKPDERMVFHSHDVSTLYRTIIKHQHEAVFGLVSFLDIVLSTRKRMGIVKYERFLLGCEDAKAAALLLKKRRRYLRQNVRP